MKPDLVVAGIAFVVGAARLITYATYLIWPPVTQSERDDLKERSGWILSCVSLMGFIYLITQCHKS